MNVRPAPPFPEYHGFTYADLHDPFRLAELDRLFREELRLSEPALADRFERYRGGASLAPVAESNLLVDAGRFLSGFLARLFDVGSARQQQATAAARDGVLFRFRWNVLQKRSAKKYPDRSSIETLVGTATDATGRALVAAAVASEEGPDSPTLLETDEELAVAVAGWDLFELARSLTTPQGKEAGYTPEAARERVAAVARRAAGAPLPLAGEPAELVARWTEAFDAYVGRLRFAPAHAPRTTRWSSFVLPGPFKFDSLVESFRPDPELPEVRAGLPTHHRPRAGFELTDRRKPPRAVLADTHYCLLCHDREKDSCSRGFKTKEGDFRKNPLGIPLTGCPLDERISEMMLLRREGDSLGALAVVCVDNPLVPGTGHRICNDCMKGCIFQAQDPVDIPQVETGALTDVLKMPWGFEIWSLLTRWNPLNRKRPVALPYNGRNVLVVGLGPAGYTLAHHLLNEGFGVVAVDGLKIEPLPAELVGGEGTPPMPVFSSEDIFRRLDERVLTGFGGVSEYGITVRWDKNFLDVIYLSLARRRTLQIFGGVRFGGTLTMEQSFRLGFDHVAIAAGAGKPTIVEMKGNLIKGVRQASDFLMALQLTGAFKEDALANLAVEMPVVVVGGGLTAIDTATEALAYYATHVEKVLHRWEVLTGQEGEEAVLSRLTAEERERLTRILSHGRQIRLERQRAEQSRETPDFARLVTLWGGSTIAYRRRLEESPAYRLNHEEIAKAFEEGIRFAENLEPVEAVPDEHGHVKYVVFRRRDGTITTLPCRTLLIAAGTTPNITYAREHEGSIPLDPKARYFRPHVAVEENGRFRPVPKDDGVGAFFTGVDVGGKLATYFGDNHPVYAGNVVKAMASARDGAPRIRELFARELDELVERGFGCQADRDAAWKRLTSSLADQLIPRVVRVERLTPTITEVVVRAPLATQAFEPGQFYRMQNYEAQAPRVSVDGSPAAPLLVEPCALTGAWVDKKKGLLSMIALEIGVSTKLCAAFRPGEPLVVMGPTGSPTHVPGGETVILCGGGLGNAVLFSIGRAARERGSKVLYFAGYKRAEDFYKRDEIEAGADVVVYTVDVPPAILKRRPQDFEFVGNIVQAMVAYAEGRLGPTRLPMSEATRLIAIGSDRMMAAVTAARKGVLAPHLHPRHVGIGSINSPMQCMMKEVCAQCLQRHVDPVTGKESFVFSCFNQDQPLDHMDWSHLRQRLGQNSLEEKLSGMWLDRLLTEGHVPRV